MTKRLLLAILVVLSLAASGCSCNRGLCRRMFNHSDGCYCCNQSMGNCGCSSCRCSPGMMNSCAMNGSYMGGCQSGMCSSCEGGSCSMCSGGSAMYSGEMSGEMMQGDGMMQNAEVMSSEGGPMQSVGTPGCNCGAQ